MRCLFTQISIHSLQGGFTGTGNVNENPQFIRDPDPGDGNWATSGDNDNGDLHLTSASPAIDAGYNSAVPQDKVDVDTDNDFVETLPDDLDGRRRFVDVSWIADTGVGLGPIVDMGTYEYLSRLIFLPLVTR